MTLFIIPILYRMGIVFGLPWSAFYSLERNEVCVNLSGLKAPVPYHFQHQSGSILIPFNLGRHVIQLGDLIELARGEIPLMVPIFAPSLSFPEIINPLNEE